MDMVSEVFCILEDTNIRVRKYILENMMACTSTQLGLDDRISIDLWVNEEGIVIRNSNKSTLNYYGGFEYVDYDCVEVVGNYTFYFAEDDRVRECIEYFMNNIYID